MEKILTAIDITDNGGRRRVRDRRFLVSVPFAREHRTNWDRRSGYDRRLRRILRENRIFRSILVKPPENQACEYRGMSRTKVRRSDEG
jgi:hypothetical protein